MIKQQCILKEPVFYRLGYSLVPENTRGLIINHSQGFYEIIFEGYNYTCRVKEDNVKIIGDRYESN